MSQSLWSFYFLNLFISFWLDVEFCHNNSIPLGWTSSWFALIWETFIVTSRGPEALIKNKHSTFAKNEKWAELKWIATMWPIIESKILNQEKFFKKTDAVSSMGDQGHL